MADDEVVASPEPSPVVAADTHKRKLEDLEPGTAPEQLAHSEPISDPHSASNGAQQEDHAAADESDSKRQRLESNGDNITESEPVLQNGNQEDEEEDNPKAEEAEQPQLAEDNLQSVEIQEPVEEHLDTTGEEPTPNENSKMVIGSDNVLDKSNAEDEKSLDELPREGDVPVQSADSEAGSGDQLLSRKMEVPNDKVGVLIGKAGDTIRSLQDNSGAKIQIMRDADADLRSVTRPLELVGTLESINKAEKLIKDVIAEADAGGSPSLVARGFSTVQAACGGEQVEILVPYEKVGLIIGRGGETIRNLQTRSGARIQLIQQNLADGDQSKERTVRITGNKRQIETAREMIKDVMNQFALPSWCINRQPLFPCVTRRETARPSPVSGGYNKLGYRPRGPPGLQWGPRGPHHAQYSGYDYPQRGPYPSPNSQYPPPSYGNYPPPQGPRSNFGPSWEQRPPPSFHGPSPQGNYNYGQHGPDYGHPPYSQAPPQQPYGHGYNDVKYDHHASSQHFGHMGSQPVPYAQGGAHSGYASQDQYGKPPNMYGMQPQAPSSQPYGQPRPNQSGEVPFQGPGSSAPVYGRNMPPQQPYPLYASQPSYPPYASAPSTDGYGHAPASGYGPPQGGQLVATYGQPGMQQAPSYSQAAAGGGGYGSYPATQSVYVEQVAAAATADGASYGYQQPPAEPGAYGVGQAPAYPAPAGQSGYAQSSQPQPTYDQSGYGNVPAPATAYGKSVSPQPAAAAGAYPQQYDSSNQMYGGHR